MHFQPERLRVILSKMAELEAIDKPLFEAGYIWCQNFIDRQEPVYKSRKQNLPIKPQLSGKETELSGKETELSLPVITHTKETILKETILKKAVILLPGWLDKKTWGDYLEMRKSKKDTPTKRATELLIAKLDRLRLAGDNSTEVLNQSIMNGWKGLFALNKDREVKGGTTKGNPRTLPARNSYTRPEDYRGGIT